jgi:hypothetical protein
MPSSGGDILEQILEVQPILHGAGTVSADALRAIARHAGTRKIQHSAETGCGATTLLLSHLSEHHTVFALDFGGSVENVRRSPLLRAAAVCFVEGPSQRTLPVHSFSGKLQLALIDGPHAYPFPDLEYYFLYPHLDAGALLVLDDIHIRSVHNLFEFLKQDEMFRLDQVVRSTAFFTRTDAPAFDPLGDDWHRQKYNQRTLLRYDWRARLAALLPRSVGRVRSNGCSLEVLSPGRGDSVGAGSVVEGRASAVEGAHLWILARRKDVDGWWPQGGGPVAIADGRWSSQAIYGTAADAGFDFEIAAVLVSGAVHEQWLNWIRNVKETGQFPPVQLPKPPHVLALDSRTVRKQR